MGVRRWWLPALWLGTVLLSICAGRYPLSLEELWAILTGGAVSATGRTLFWQIRLPRVVLTALGGGALALAGETFQLVFSNPLVSPDVLGVSSGASVGAVFALLFLPRLPFLGESAAFFGGLSAVALALWLARFVRHNRVLGMVLAGIVVGSATNALLMLLKYQADPQHELPAIEYWLMGGFQGAMWHQIWPVLALTAPAAWLLWNSRFVLKLLSLGDEEAGSLGLRPGRVRLLAVACATVLTAAIVSVAGVVSWIGLIAPHLARLLVGGDRSRRMGAVCLLGSTLLLWADLCARTLTAAEIPISIFTSLFGAVLLAALLVRGELRRGGDAL